MAKAPQAPKPSAKKTIPYSLIGLLVIAVGLVQAIVLRWVSDDSFITFRYVKNFVDGNGIVYNIGERIEGYTHFLWLLILSFTKLIGFDPVIASMWIGVACFALLLTIYLRISYKEQTSSSYLPLVAILLALNYDMLVWVTGGLETSLYTLLISVAFYCWFYTKLPQQRKLLLVGSLLLLTALTRPDGALFTITGAILLAGKNLKENKSIALSLKEVTLLLLPSIIIGVPYLLWKYNYYGDIFPTTFYAKSGDENYFGQGFFYIFLFFKVYFTLALSLIAFGIWYFMKRPRPAEAIHNTTAGSPILTAIILVAVYFIIYIAKVGGDFMFARFIIPVLPLIYFIVERSLDRADFITPLYKWGFPIVLIGMVVCEGHFIRTKVLFHYDVNSNQLEGDWGNEENPGEVRGIADERWVYLRERFTLNGEKRSSIDVYSEVGKFLEPYFHDLPVTVAIGGAQNSIAYYGNFHNVVNVYGLTDKEIAHAPIAKRGRIGHEKKATLDYLTGRDVNYYFFDITDKLPNPMPWDLAVFSLPQYGLYLTARVVTYNKEITQELTKRFANSSVPVGLQRYEQIIPKYIQKVLPTLPPDQAEENHKRMNQLYFRKYPNPEAQHEIDSIMSEKRK
ncbi:MAG TPA: hypothetical protein VFO76_05575 [Candidatus Kapabacteria bacterium]|nr:hypothetical protein [Candidatus Kapabacteria bacterium]